MALSATFIYSLYDGFVYGSYSNYFPAKALSILTIIFFIIIVFYTYTSFTKKPILVLDILLFFFSIYFAQKLFYFIISLNPFEYTFQYISVVLLFIIFGSYMTLTLLPLENIIFQDPITKKYGILRNKNR